MARRPTTGLLAQYAKNAGGASAAGYWLKFFSATYGASTSPITMYTQQTGGVGLAKCKLNTRGEPISDSLDDDSTFIPYIDGDWDAYIFFTEADADANNTVNSIYLGTNVQAADDLLSNLQFATVATLKTGDALNRDSTVDFSDYVGRKVTTVVNNTTSNKGGAGYIIKTAAQVTADGDVIDGYGNHWLLGGTAYAAILIPSASGVDVFSFGFISGSGNDNSPNFGALLDFCQQRKIFSIYSDSGNIFYLDSRVQKTVNSLFMDMSGSEFFANYTDQAAPVINITVNDFCEIKNVSVDGNNTAHRPIAITGGTLDFKMVGENITSKNAYGIGAGSLAVIGLYITGIGDSVSLVNTTIEGVNSDAGRSNTSGITVGRGVSNDQNFFNVTIINTTLKNITEQLGTTITDSDGIKVFGAISQSDYSERRTNCIIDGVHIKNDSGLNLKRIVKTQVSQYDVRNITGVFSNTDINVFVDNQYGSGSVNNIDLQLQSVAVSTGIVNNPQFGDSNTLNSSGCTIENVSVMGVTCTATTLTQSFYSRANRRSASSYKNWYIKGFTYTNFGVFEIDDDDRFADFQNINLRDSTITGDYAFLGTGDGVSRNYMETSFINFQTDRMVAAVGLYSGDGSVWGRFLPVKVVNTSLYFMGNDGEVGRYLKFGEFLNARYKYASRTVAQKAGGIGSTIIKVYNDLASFNYEMIKFSFKTKQNANISNSAFTVYFDTATTVAVAEIVESNVGTLLLATPSASFNSSTNEITISFSTDATSNQQAMIDIDSTLEFEVVELFGITL